MAKIGEGDARWQVADLAESGRNVNNWHWVEKDAMDWCKERLTELLTGADLAPGAPPGLSARCTTLKACEGEAVVNNRKNKIIAAYELAVTLGWEGAAEAGGEAVTGEVRLPYVSEENHDEDPEMQVATSTEGPAAQKVRAAILSGGKKVVHDAIAVFVKELREGGPMRSGAAQPKAAPAKPVDAVAATEAGAGGAPANGATPPVTQQQQQQRKAATEEPKAAAAAGGSSGHSVEIKERFYAGAADLYECFTVPRRIMAYTQSPAEAVPQPGGTLSMFGGSVQGVYRELSPNQSIVMDWRFSNWEEGAWSRVELRFEEPDKGNTIVTMKQTGIPDADQFGNHDVVGVAEAGWRGQVFERIRRVFGYGC